MADKTPLILVPGLLLDAAMWTHQVEALADVADCTVVDILPHDSLADMADAVLAAANGTFALAGLSLGGYIAFEVMRRAPERVDRLAIINASARADTPQQTKTRHAEMARVGEGKFGEVEAEILLRLIHEDRLSDTALTREISAMAWRCGPESFARHQKAIMERPDSRGDLASIRCPTLVLVGRQDLITPLAMHEEIAAAVPGATLVVVEDCGHLATMEHPEAVNAAMRDWLAA